MTHDMCNHDRLCIVTCKQVDWLQLHQAAVEGSFGRNGTTLLARVPYPVVG